MKWQFSLLLVLLFPALTSSYDSCSLDSLDLNREGAALTSSELEALPESEFGFKWNDDDESTLKWRPQGITGITTAASKEYMAVSWYGREEENYADRGVRISFADITNMQSAVMYRHVLLVDENYQTFEGMHGGGLVHVNGLLHVPDSRSGTKKIYTFNTSDILYIPEADREEFYDYVYILVRTSSYDVPITPSFMSYDWDRQQILLGTFYQCSSYHIDSDECLMNTFDRLMWYGTPSSAISTPSCAPFYSEMQGAASARAPGSSSDNSSSAVLWVSSSYGSGHESHLHASWIQGDLCSGAADDNTIEKGAFRTISYPPGLEDLFASSSSQGLYNSYLWMLTEFGTAEGSGNIRRVFAAGFNNILPD